MNPLKGALQAYWDVIIRGNEYFVNVKKSEYDNAKKTGEKVAVFGGKDGEAKYFRIMQMQDTEGNEADLTNLLLAKIAKSANTIKVCALFFTVLAIISLALTFIQLLV